MVSFVRENNMYVEDLGMQRRERALTRDGSAKILNGRLDWVYQEELYGRGNFGAYWWSPDSTSSLFCVSTRSRFRSSRLSITFPITRTLEVTPYPKAGDPNPIVKLGVVNAAGGDIRWIDTFKYQPADLLISRVTWTPDGKKVVYQAQNREQTFLDVNFADARDGKSSNVIHETSKAWVAINENPIWLKDGSFIWASERNGWEHLYHYSADGKLLRQITDGKWEVRSIEGVDEAEWLHLFHRAPSTVTSRRNGYRIKLDGTGLTRLTQTEGSHRVDLSPANNYFIDVWSDRQHAVADSSCTTRRENSCA